MQAASAPPAGFASRTVALSIDAAILALSVSLTVFFMSSISSLIHLSLEPRRDAWAAIAVSAIGVVLTIGYNIVSWSLTGRTPGKAIMGIRVVSQDGGRVSVGKASLRLLGYLLSSLPLGAGFGWVLVDDQRLAWHDHLAGTRVVYAPRRVKQEPSVTRRAQTVTVSSSQVERSVDPSNEHDAILR